MNRREFLKMGGMSVMALVLGGCGLSSLTGSSSNGQAANSAASGVAASSSGTVAAGGKTLVVYYSATGRTERVAKVIAKEAPADVDALMACPWHTGNGTVDDAKNELFLSVRENMKVRRFERIEGKCVPYVHMKGKVAVLV